MKSRMVGLPIFTSHVFAGNVKAENIKNDAFKLNVSVVDGGLAAEVTDLVAGRAIADGEYYYRAETAGGTIRLEKASVSKGKGRIIIRGKLAGLDVEHTLSVPSGRGIMEERIVVRNNIDAMVALNDFEAGFTIGVTGKDGKVLDDLSDDRWMAVPFLRRADFAERRELSKTASAPFPRDMRDIEYDFPINTILDEPGFEYHPRSEVMQFAEKRMPSRHRFSEGWAWMHDERHITGIFSFSQEHMTFSTVTPHDSADGKRLRFGGACLLETTLGALRCIQPGQTVDSGVTRYQPVEGGYNDASYAFRAMLDERGCRFPENFNAPVHWNQLYNMGSCRNREKTHTVEAYEKEAAKAVQYSCEELYLDPGWDTAFGSFVWRPSLGDGKKFIDMIKTKYGLAVGLHFPLAPWMSSDSKEFFSAWSESCRRDPGKAGAVGTPACMGSKQYLDEAIKRAWASCEAGAIFLMFDGSWWQGNCFDKKHGHPIPYTYEDHIRSCVYYAQQVHSKYPNVLIEMHDMLAGGEWRRMTPVYYKYGLPGSYDLNWGFELMWSPMLNLKHGSSDVLYYYALGCNVPMYLHVHLNDDNIHAVSLWWYASTCRHLGIGGDNKHPGVAQAHKNAMKTYRELEDFYKRGEFYGITREIHLHVLPEKKAFTVNVFNLSNEARTISGEIDLRTMGLDPDLEYVSRDGVGKVENGKYFVSIELPAWGTKVGKSEERM